jgi:polyhydroxyalkanoate synthase
VIFQNELMQLFQYAPATAEVFEKPLLIIPPWINKFYILDLGQKKSMVRWLVSQGYTVFMISWVNPDESLKDKSFEDYMVDGPMAALAEIRKATGANEVNVVGYCIGGTLLACLLAYLESSPEEKARLPKISAATYFVTLLDFRDAGEISVFIDEENLKSMEEHMAAHGYFDGQTMAAAFNMLRANDLIWSFVVNNYLLGREPLPFDLLYWNADSTRMPAAMHSFYLREMYRKNSLAKPGGLQMKGVPIDLTKISTPAYFLSTREDHIAPWRSTYFGAQMMKGPVTFDLTSSGHIAGVVNPPAMSKYHHWINSKLAGTPEEWLKSSSPRDGSWWPSWEGWLRIYSGKKVPAREPGAGGATIIEDAPGSYVRVRAV